MKLNSKTQHGLNMKIEKAFAAEVIEMNDKENMTGNYMHFRLFLDESKVENPKGVQVALEEIKQKYNHDANLKNTNYLITATALNVAKDIKNVSFEKFDLNILKTIPEGKKTFLLGDNYYRYVRENTLGKNALYAFYKRNNKRGFFEIDFDFPAKDADLKDPEFVAFVQLLCFVELSEKNIELRELIPNQSVGQMGTSSRYKNESDQNIIIVNSKWNIATISEGEFTVRGHLRLQACGKNWSDLRLIYIAPFIKHGITRNAHLLQDKNIKPSDNND
jgi:hypothetical protein